MGESVLADNWSLQDIAELIGGAVPPGERMSLLDVDVNGSPSRPEVSGLAIRLEALIELLTNVVLYDRVLLDAEFANTWSQGGHPFEPLLRTGVLHIQTLPERDARIRAPRDVVVRSLAFHPALLQHHELNMQAYEREGVGSDRHAMQVHAGGAGMLARSWVYELPYSPHPVRKRFFQRAGFMCGDLSATQRTVDALRAGRVDLYRGRARAGEMTSVRLVVDAVALRVVREATTSSDLFEVATQMRSTYRPLREWLGHYQQALAFGDDEQVRALDALVHDAVASAQARARPDGKGGVAVNVGIDGIKLTVPSQLIGQLRNRFGIRSLLTSLVGAGSGEGEFRRLLELVGHRRTADGLEALHAFMAGPRELHP